MELTCSLKDFPLYWALPSQIKSFCIKCSSPDHLTKNCDAIRSRKKKPTPRHIQNLYDKMYKPRSSRSKSRGRSRFRAPSTSRLNRSSRNRSRSSGESINKSGRKRSRTPVVSYAEITRSDRNFSSSSSDPIPKKSDFDALAHAVRQAVKDFQSLKSEFNEWKSTLPQINSRLANIEQALKISPPKVVSTPPPKLPVVPPFSPTKGFRPPSDFATTPPVQNPVLSPSSGSFNHDDSKRLNAFEGRLGDIDKTMNSVLSVLDRFSARFDGSSH